MLKKSYKWNFMGRSFRKSLCSGDWLEEEGGVSEPFAGTVFGLVWKRFVKHAEWRELYMNAASLAGLFVL